MNTWDLIPALLLTLLSVALISGAAVVLLMGHWRRRQTSLSVPPTPMGEPRIIPVTERSFSHRPTAWLAVRGRSLQAVQSALGLSNPRPCTWIQGLSTEQKLFIAPPIDGWILVTGCGLPDPSDDVDMCFRLLLRLSHKLGHVQFFSANRAVGNHAWARAESGKIVRAYAWAGRTLWNQGRKTHAELVLGVRCYDYFETPESELFETHEAAGSNTEKVPQLAAQWSIDPAGIDERLLDHACGVAGEAPHLY